MIEAKRSWDVGDRESVVLGDDDFTVMVNADKGMVPELAVRTGHRWVNAHWNPWFRATVGEPWDESRHAERWKVPLLYDMAGNFPCTPNFGPPQRVGDHDLPAHGVTASETWLVGDPRADDRRAMVESHLSSPIHPLTYRKWDLVIAGQPIHYVRLDVTNPTDESLPYQIGWHNTVGPPFLESGCLIDNDATAFAVPPRGTEFDDTGRLAFGAECESLERVPTRRGGVVNLREVVGPVGYADLISGAVPLGGELGWSSVVNPRLGLVYLCFFPGPGTGMAETIDLNFYDLWLNYGGRHFMPWAAADDRKDRSFCLGTESATGYFANGLADGLEHPNLLGRPSYLSAAPKSTASLHYATAFFAYDDGALDAGVERIERTTEGIALVGKGGKSARLPADSGFEQLSRIDDSVFG